jgi:uncharacterized protein (TIGR03905 family)
MKISFVAEGSCAKRIDLEVTGGKIVTCEFMGGTPGNPEVIAALAEGMEVTEAIKCLRNFACNGDTSCPGRLALALEEAMSK